MQARQKHHLTRWASVLLVTLGLVACDKPTEPAKSTASPAAAVDTFTVLATSDLKDAQPLEKMVEDATGVKLRFKFGGTMESTEAVQTGQANTDAAWFANAKYLLSDPQGQGRVKLQEKIMLSPVVVGVSESQAKVLGWDQPEVARKVTWNVIAKAAQSGQLKYALSNPATSNQGFMSLMGVVASAAQKSEALTASDVDRAAIAGFIKGYKLVGDNSSYLSEKFIEQQNTRVNAFINYESWLLSLNQSGKLKEKLTLIYPHEGVATADYPLMLLNDAKREQYLKVVAYLKGDAAQTWLAKTTLRRPVNSEVAKAQASLFPQDSMLVELPFSTDRALADGLINAYLNEFRTPIASTFVLDVSGSMNQGGRRQQLVEALQYIAGDDASLTGRIARLTSREKVWMLPFSEQVYSPVFFQLPGVGKGAATGKGLATQADSEGKQKVLGQVRDFADSLNMTGGTALYDAVLTALVNMHEERQKNPGYQYSVVAFTDGEVNKGRDMAQFKAAYANLPEDVRAIPVFMVLFGEANEAALKELVATTGGRVFDARKASLYSVFKDIRAYQ
ncbi:VWA domain-containing protein [Rhodoferax sp. AJA081-3]|uniref:vWA domain-containing protein n=1 Tax=Rhodoferax sp. AJA081-3 TaxID=2752316 RepID=UPI001AE0AEF1|nr:VWA domain-containing protein [Rhodoferax sp. AJA081-3]QTN27518.1 VWA domain-containing protein [Rhodoferax sp. AJA081-3]